MALPGDPLETSVDGEIRFTYPAVFNARQVDDVRLRFEAGEVVEATASRGQDFLERMLAIDDGARRLGEVALVPHSSPIAASGLLFYNTLFDENAASHIALGQAYSKCIKDGDKLSETELAARGCNRSLIHIDWMIGSAETDIDGVHAYGRRVPVFRKGEWA